jgi:hypothetical protein
MQNKKILKVTKAFKDLSKLEAARQLLPDAKDSRCQPELAGWGKKRVLFGEMF